MPRCVQCLLAAAAVSAGSAVRHRLATGGAAPSCEKGAEDEVGQLTHIVSKVCLINWFNPKRANKTLEAHMQEGCWGMQIYNTDKHMSSAVYQNQVDGRCLLAFSGYHGHLTGMIYAAHDLTTPMTTWKVCENEAFAPFVRLLRGHTKLSNWTKMANFLGGNETTCKGELVVAAESAGGSAAEILASCANQGLLGQVQNKSAANFQVGALYTYGAPASSKNPVSNALHPSGCFRGKRIFNYQDTLALYSGIKDMRHGKMDSIEIFDRRQGPTFKVTPCLSNVSTPTTNSHASPGPPLVTSLKWKDRDDASHHEIFTYEKALKFFKDAGYGNFVTADLVEPGSDAYVSALRLRPPDAAQ